MNIDKDGGTDYARKELQQQKHYAYLSQLQSMSRELPVWATVCAVNCQHDTISSVFNLTCYVVVR